MDYLKPADFKQLKAFLLALQQSRFNLKQISSVVIMDGVRTPVDKTHCLELLRSFPDLSGEEFKDDNFLIKHLSQPGNIKRILGRLTTSQQIELTKVLEEKPVTVEVTGEQPGVGETSAEQGVPPETPVGTATGTAGMPGLPSAPSISSAPRAPRIVISHTPDQPFQGPGQGTAATNKMRGIQEKAEIERVGAATAKANRLTAQTTALRTETQLASSGNLNPSTVSGSYSPTPPRFNWRGFKMPASFTNAAKNFGSASQRFIGTNLGRMGRGLGEIAGGVGRGIAGPGLTGAYNLLGKVGNGGLNAFEKLSSPSLRGASRSFMSSGSKKMAWGLVGALVFFVIGAGLIGGLTGGGTSSQTGNVGIGTTAALISPIGIQLPSNLTGITSAASQITSLLFQKNPTSVSLEDRLFHNKKDEPSVYYWCTYLVVDAYNAAGFTGLSRSAHGGVLSMKSFFVNTPGYQFLPRNTLVEQLRPGDVIFFEGSRDQHTSLIKSIDVSQEGNGIIRTYESNNVVIEDIVFVQNHQATVAKTTASKFTIIGFGQVRGQQT